MVQEKTLEELKNQSALFMETIHGTNTGSAIYIYKRELCEDSKKKGKLIQNTYYNIFDLSFEFEKADNYISLNGFKPKTSRMTENCNRINGLFFDFDYHDTEDVEERDTRIKNTLWAFFDAFKQKFLLEPTMITTSGRGVGVYYILDNPVPLMSDEDPKSLKKKRFYKFIYTDIYHMFEHVLNEAAQNLGPVLSADYVGDLSRICRIPGAWNTKAKRYCELVHFTGKKYSLKDLDAMIPDNGKFEWNRKKREWEEERTAVSKKSYEKTKEKPKQQNNAFKIPHILRNKENRGKLVDTIIQIKLENPSFSLRQIEETLKEQGYEYSQYIVKRTVRAAKDAIVENGLDKNDWETAFKIAREKEDVPWRSGSFHNYSMIEKIENLQKLRKFNCKGYRHNMCYAYGRMLQGKMFDLTFKDRKERNDYLENQLRAFNMRFSEPLPEDEIEKLIKTLKRVPSKYQLTNEWCINQFKITKKEQDVLFTHINAKADKRDFRLKAHDIVEREIQERDKKIIELAKQTNPVLQFAEIAELADVTVRTVNTVLHKNGIYRKGAYRKKNKKKETNVEGSSKEEKNNEKTVVSFKEGQMNVSVCGAEWRLQAALHSLKKSTDKLSEMPVCEHLSKKVKKELFFSSVEKSTYDFKLHQNLMKKMTQEKLPYYQQSFLRKSVVLYIQDKFSAILQSLQVKLLEFPAYSYEIVPESLYLKKLPEWDSENSEKAVFLKQLYFKKVYVRKSGLIRFNGGYYSMPYKYWIFLEQGESLPVYIVPDYSNGLLHIFDFYSEKHICSHYMQPGIVINPGHIHADICEDFSNWMSPERFIYFVKKKLGILPSFFILKYMTQFRNVYQALDKAWDLYESFKYMSLYVLRTCCLKTLNRLVQGGCSVKSMLRIFNLLVKKMNFKKQGIPVSSCKKSKKLKSEVESTSKAMEQQHLDSIRNGKKTKDPDLFDYFQISKNNKKTLNVDENGFLVLA